MKNSSVETFVGGTVLRASAGPLKFIQVVELGGMIRKTLAICLCATIGLPNLLHAFAQNTNQTVAAIIPYSTMYDLAQKQGGVTDKSAADDTTYFLMITSRLPGVQPKDISLYINRKDGRIPLIINETGWFQLPVSVALIAENPPVIANQPKGTMVLSVDTTPFERPPLEGGSTNSVEKRWSIVFEQMKPLIDPNYTLSSFVTDSIATMKQAQSPELFLRIHEAAAATCERFAPKKPLTTKHIFIILAIILKGGDAKYAAQLIDRVDPPGKDGLSTEEIDNLYKVTSEELDVHGLQRMSPPNRGVEWKRKSKERQK